MTKALIVSVVAAAGLLLARPAFAVFTTPAVLAETETALDRGDAQHAANLADSALKQQGLSAAERGRLLLYRGLGQELLGASAGAMHDFTQALDSRALPPEERAQALLQRGFLRDGLGRLDEAIADYTAVIILKGDNLATALNNRANIYRRQNKPAQARQDYLAALSAGNSKPQYSYYGLGQIAEAQHDVTAARGFYAKAVAADPGYGLASERLAALGGPPDGAIADTGRLALHPPPAANEMSADAGFKVATEAANRPANDTPIVLRPPHSKEDGTIILHPPGMPRAAGPARGLRPPQRPLPMVVGAVLLRPAMDQSGRSLPGTGAAEVQLGAWRSAAEARAGWDKAELDAGGALDGLTPHVVTVDLPDRGRYYRLRVSPPGAQDRGEFCAVLARKGIACLPVHDGRG
jgi:tetratricopeptide (TPR) repeat protein